MNQTQLAALRVALAGNPNCGKTTLFNALTGACQRVGNWPGVTVEHKSGYFVHAAKEVEVTAVPAAISDEVFLEGESVARGQRSALLPSKHKRAASKQLKAFPHSSAEMLVEVIDLPGVYSLTLASDAAVDESIACEFLLQQPVDVVVNIVDASNLDRHLYLTMQLLEMGVPVILALNMMDIANARHIHIDLAFLAQALGCPVIALEATRGGGIKELKHAIMNYDGTRVAPKKLAYPDIIQAAIQEIICHLNTAMPANNQHIANPVNNAHTAMPANNKHTAMPAKAGIQAFANNLPNASLRWHDKRTWLAARLLEDDVYARKLTSPDLAPAIKAQQMRIQQALGEDADILFADTRYRYIQELIQHSITHTGIAKTTWTARIDNIVLNRVLGIPIFLSVMYLLFVFAINVGGAFQDFFDLSSQTIFVDGFSYLLSHLSAPAWLTALLANGIGKGINTTITFIPVIGTLFLFLAFLEDSGYMARAAFVIDRFMRVLGLPGKAFVPMIVGFGCNVPAVMSARTLENKRDRIITIMMSPFMSCGARLAIYAVFTAAFFPRGGQNVVFALYLIGIFMAIFTGFMLRKTALKGEPSPLVMELPLYHLPRIKTLLLHAWQRLKGFVLRAGKLIVPICVLIGALNALNVNGSINTGNGDAHSLLSLVGQWATPIFAPMGIHADNWPATVGLVTGVLAKEVVVGTLNTLYTQIGHFTGAGGVDTFHFWGSLAAAAHTIPQNLAQLGSAFSNPIAAQAPFDSMNQGVYGLMYQKFDGRIGAFAYLLFVLLYFPCISTMAAMLRELHRGWSVFSACWMTGVAYGTAVTFYQAATWARHPLSSSLWIASIISIFVGTIIAIRCYTGRQGMQENYTLATVAGGMR